MLYLAIALLAFLAVIHWRSMWTLNEQRSREHAIEFQKLIAQQQIDLMTKQRLWQEKDREYHRGQADGRH